MATITEKNIQKFITAYKKAIKESKKQFMFEGQEVLTSYAKYVIEYANTLIK